MASEVDFYGDKYIYNVDGTIMTTFDGIPLESLCDEEVVYIRERFRAIKEYKVADAIREYLERRGVKVVDGVSVSYGNLIN